MHRSDVGLALVRIADGFAGLGGSALWDQRCRRTRRSGATEPRTLDPPSAIAMDRDWLTSTLRLTGWTPGPHGSGGAEPGRYGGDSMSGHPDESGERAASQKPTRSMRVMMPSMTPPRVTSTPLWPDINTR